MACDASGEQEEQPMPGTANVDLDRLKGMTILLAEDNVTNQLVATQMLQTLGAEVDIAADGAIALERLNERVYDVLLIDIEMPRVSGLDVIRSVRASDGPLADAPVIALTAYAMQDHREKITSVGADGLIPKPITSIQQFGVDILTLMDTRAAAGSAASRDGAAEIDRALYDSFAESLGPEAMQSILTRTEIDLVEQRAALAIAAETGDFEMMAGASHILISVGGMVGGVRLQRQSERLNALAKDRNLDAMAPLAADALRELDGVMEFVRKERRALEG